MLVLLLEDNLPFQALEVLIMFIFVFRISLDTDLLVLILVGDMHFQALGTPVISLEADVFFNIYCLKIYTCTRIHDVLGNTS